MLTDTELMPYSSRHTRENLVNGDEVLFRENRFQILEAWNVAANGWRPVGETEFPQDAITDQCLITQEAGVCKGFPPALSLDQVPDNKGDALEDHGHRDLTLWTIQYCLVAILGQLGLVLAEKVCVARLQHPSQMTRNRAVPNILQASISPHLLCDMSFVHIGRDEDLVRRRERHQDFGNLLQKTLHHFSCHPCRSSLQDVNVLG